MLAFIFSFAWTVTLSFQYEKPVLRPVTARDPESPRGSVVRSSQPSSSLRTAYLTHLSTLSKSSVELVPSRHHSPPKSRQNARPFRISRASKYIRGIFISTSKPITPIPSPSVFDFQRLKMHVPPSLARSPDKPVTTHLLVFIHHRS